MIVTLADLAGEIRVKSRVTNFQPLARLVPAKPPVMIRFQQHNLNHETNMVAELSPRQIEAIEDMRLGEGLIFSARLAGLARWNSGVQRVEEDNAALHVNQGTWVEVLGELGYQKTLLLEVPVPDASSHPEMSEAVGHLACAQQAMYRGDWREAVGSCRDVLESLSRALGDVEEVRNATVKSDPKADRTTRLRGVRKALKNLCHPARHADEHAARIEWSRADALSVVSMVAALLGQIGHTQP